MRTNAARHIVACAALGALVLAAGCGRRGAGAAAAAAAGAERRFSLSGEVVSADTKRRILVVRHNEIAGYMPAMTMEFAVAPGDAAAARPGERIRAELVVGRDGAARLEGVWPDDRVSLDTIDAGARMLRQDTLEKGGAAYREIGERVPDFALYDQNGLVVSSARFRGRQVMLNFIYSRCPIANMCPLATSKMMATQKLARDAGVANIEFVSITLEPTYDTPGVLNEYARDRGIDTGNFSFLTGPEPAIRDLLTQFGVIDEFKGGIRDHTLATILIDDKGRIAWRADGSAWEPRQFVERMRR
jgi:protein SCO1/2